MSSYVAARRRLGAALLAATTATALLLMSGGTNADAAIVPNVPLGTAAAYSVLGGSTVTNSGNSVLNRSLGLFPGTDITGFPPGLVHGTTNQTNAAAAQAKSDLTAAYVNAAGRPIAATTTADLGGLLLQAGVYAGPSKGALGLTGTVTLDGAGNADSVFIFQTNSSLITASGSTVVLTGGAQECNVYWQVGSSATLGTGSTFRGTILALSSISLNDSVTVHGRALARNGAVTLLNDTFESPTCSGTSGGGGTTATTVPGGTTATTTPAAGGGTTTGTTPGGGSTTSATTPGTATGTDTTGPGVPGVSGPPRTGGAPLRGGSSPWFTMLFVILIGGGTGLALVRRRPGDHAESLIEH
jgi:Ice-binding-like